MIEQSIIVKNVISSVGLQTDIAKKSGNAMIATVIPMKEIKIVIIFIMFLEKQSDTRFKNPV